MSTVNPSVTNPARRIIQPVLGLGHGKVSRISVDPGEANTKRFVMSIAVPADMAKSIALVQVNQYEEVIRKATAALNSTPLADADKLALEAQIKIANECIERINKTIGELVDHHARYEYFSTPRTSPDSIRINAQQLRNAFPELMTITTDDGVFIKLLTDRSKFIGRDVSFTVSEQIDRDTKLPKKGPDGRIYTNVRLEASSSDVPEDEAALLWGSETANINPAAAGDAKLTDDIPGL